MTFPSKDARLLLLWIVARQRGIINITPARHEEILDRIPDLGAVYGDLTAERLCGRRGS
jgi:hypothetical protein